VNKPRKRLRVIAPQLQALAHQFQTEYGHREDFQLRHQDGTLTVYNRRHGTDRLILRAMLRLASLGTPSASSSAASDLSYRMPDMGYRHTSVRIANVGTDVFAE
jgi:hypothetical protein